MSWPSPQAPAPGSSPHSAQQQQSQSPGQQYWGPAAPATYQSAPPPPAQYQQPTQQPLQHSINANYYQYPQHNYTQSRQPAPAWEDNSWDWSWEERNQLAQSVAPPHAHNVSLEESFAGNQSWSWTASSEPALDNSAPPAPPPPIAASASRLDSCLPPAPSPTTNAASPEGSAGVQERRPLLEDLTPQWSVESQMSESSDGALGDSSCTPDPSGDAVRALRDLNLSNVENPVPDNAECERELRAACATAAPPPPTAFPQVPHAPAVHNPYKRTAALAHAASKGHPAPPRGSDAFLSANLETPPDNSERPDQPHAASPQDSQHGVECAVRRDRNEYLQTAHLSSAGFGEYAAREAGAGEADGPPPGLARMVPGQNTDAEPRAPDAYRERQADGQTDTRAQYGFVPGEDEFVQQFGDDVRVVTGLDSDSEPAARELDGDGSESARARALAPAHSDNLQDLSVVSSTELSFRDQNLDGAPEIAASAPAAGAPRVRAPTSGDDTDRDRVFKSSPRRDKRRGEAEREAERGGGRREAESGSTQRGAGRRGREDAARRAPRYDTEDTDYNSDRERERRKHREGSYSSARPPRPDDRYPRDKRTSRYNTLERDRRYERDARERERDRGRDERYSNSLRHPRRRGHESREPDPTEDELNETAGSRRARDAERERRRHRPPADYYAVRDADPYQAQLAQQQELYRYYEHLRRTDPAAYMHVYTSFMAGHPLPPPPTQHTQPLGPFRAYAAETAGTRDERGSVHSGRSSANALALSRDTYDGGWYYARPPPPPHRPAPSASAALSDYSGSRDLTTELLNPALEESTVRSDRMTPFKFCTAHVKASMSRHMVLVRAAYPRDGVPATVQLLSLPVLLGSESCAQRLRQYPGPLVRGVTHKKSVVEYCEARVREAAAGATGEAARDLPGYLLLWQLLILLLRQNGVVVGADIAELLVRSEHEHEYPRVARSQRRPGSRRDSDVSTETPPSEPPAPPVRAAPDTDTASDAAAALHKYREFLLFGNRKDALEHAMSCGLWAHALQLATTLGDRRARAAVSARYLASLAPADPLHTLYSALAGRRPRACSADAACGDWRPHLAVLLANPSARPDLDQQAITALGDGLIARGLPYAAQFCYVMARVEFGRHPLAPLGAGPAPAAPPRLALLLAPPRPRGLAHLAATAHIAATEIYEYACALSDPAFHIPELVVYKWLMACRLADCGQWERAAQYTEQVAAAILAQPARYSRQLVALTAEFAERLRFVNAHESEPLHDEASSPEHSPERPAQPWLQHLAALAQQHSAQPAGYLQHDAQHHQHDVPQNHPVDYAPPQDYSQPPSVEMYASANYGNSGVAEPSVWTPHLTPQHVAQHTAQHTPQHVVPHTAQHTPQHTPQHVSHQSGNEESAASACDADPPTPEGDSADYWTHNNYTEEESRPHITMPGGGGGGGGGAPWDDDAHNNNNTQENQRRGSDSGVGVPRGREREEDAGGGRAGAAGGWFGGIFNKLSLKPKNQMILPDDKNPTIVWDAERKRWRNKDGAGGGEEDGGDVPPPPPTAPLLQHNNHTGAAPPPPGVSGNVFKLQKGRNMKKLYVDVLNPGGGSASPAPAAPAAPPPAPAHYFVPTLQP